VKEKGLRRGHRGRRGRREEKRREEKRREEKRREEKRGETEVSDHKNPPFAEKREGWGTLKYWERRHRKASQDYS